MPTLSLIDPPDNALTNNPRPTFRLGLGASCSGTPCLLPDTYIRSLTFEVDLTGQAVGPFFTIDGTEARFTPSARLPEGLNTLKAKAKDLFGHTSEEINSRFTVDTVAPNFIALSPADGSTVTTGAVTINGQVDDPAANVFLNNASGSGISMGGANFSFAVLLQPGTNTFTLTARDAAGNTTTVPLRLTFFAPLNIAIQSPAEGATVTGSSVTVVGSIAAPPGTTVTVNGHAATISGGTFTVVVPLNQGSNSLTAIASAPDGRTSTQTLTVIRSSSGLPPDPVTVAPPNDRTVPTQLFTSTAFLYAGPNPIQTGVAPGTIEPKRAAVVRGKTFMRDGTPLTGVIVAVLNHPEFGQTLSRADGMFDLAVNGGGILTINFSKNGYLSAQRQVNAPWRDYVIAEDVALVPIDSQVTTISASAVTPQVARGSISSDADGTRRATLLFMPGTTATMTLPNGTAQALTTLNVRATEYTVGENGSKAMPAPLPPTSGYTYAVELSVDEAIAAGAKEVVFSQPVIQYVENFLNFPVGGIVPVGYYDREKAAWIPSDNGKVIKVLSTSGGLAEVDANGDDVPDTAQQLAAIGITDTERAQIVSLYSANTSLWRIPVTHFTPWDYNWPFGPPPDAKAPEQPDPKKDEKEKDPCKQQGSIIECQSQILGERIPIVGTPFSLHYQSDQVPGRKAASTLSINLTGSTVPASLRRVELQIEVAGRQFAYTFPASPNQTHVFGWDGLDAYGRVLSGAQVASINLGYVYQAVYQQPAQFARSFGGASGAPMSGNRARQEITISQNWREPIGPWDARGQGLGAWRLMSHHVYDPIGKVVYLGNGNRRAASDIASIIATVAGAAAAELGDGGLATQAGLGFPEDVTVASDGSLYIISGNRVRGVTPDGIIRTVAGTGSQGSSGDGGPATQAKLNEPLGIATGPDGSLYIAENGGQRIRRVSPAGIISTVAGTGSAGFSGDGGLATGAQLRFPKGVAVGPDGSLYIADSGNNRVRHISPGGIITIIAGTGAFLIFSGDGGPATQAALNDPHRVTVGQDGSVYIADRLNNRIRRVTPDGIIRTVAGTGTQGFSGDGGPATQASLSSPLGLTIGSDGTLYISDCGNNRIRRVSPSSIITTVAGIGIGGFSGDGGPATQARLGDCPVGVAVGPDRDLNIADFSNQRIRKVSSLFPQFSSGEFIIAAADGQELYLFTADGRHVRTKNAKTGTAVYEFGYGPEGLLVSMTDADGNVTRIERETGGVPIGIIAPDGQRTTLTLDNNGFLASVANPAGESHAMAYASDGLLTSFTSPRGHASRFAYDAEGRLTRDEDAAGGSWSLARTTTNNGYEVTKTSALNRATTYHVDKLPTGDRQWVNTGSDGTQSRTLFKIDGTTVTTTADGATITTVEGPDPRFGMQAPIEKSLTTRTPSGLTRQVTTVRNSSLSDPSNLLSLQTQTDIVTRSGKTTTTVFDANTRQYFQTSPTGRQAKTTIDAQGRPTRLEVTGIDPITYTYDPRGRLSNITQGSGSEQRTTTLDYNSQGFLGSATDAANRALGFTYDNAGRVQTQTLPDGRAITWSYDANGNVLGITPPSKPSHNFTYTPVDLEASYTPPSVSGITNPNTQYAYNLDKQLTTITRPDGKSVIIGYDGAGRLSTITPNPATAGATLTYGYNVTTGQRTSVNTSSGTNLTYTYDGFLPIGEAWSGPIAGAVTRTYNNDFLTSSIGVNGTSIAFGYDNDNLLTQAGSLTINRNPQNGLITGTTLSGTTTTHTYNNFGEVNRFTTNQGANPLLDIVYTRDKLGRITQKVDTIGGSTDTFDYGYDLADRLTTVTKNGVPQATYAYDGNGNRQSKTTGSGTVGGTYDDQDRLLTYGGNNYGYTDNGELKTKTDGTGTTSYTYDVLGNLTNVTLPSGTTIEYVIDGRNRRVGKKVNGTLTQGFLYQNQLKPIVELDGSGTIVARFIYATKTNVPDYMIKGATTYRIISDHLGSPRLILNTSNGNVEQRLDYDEFGNVTLDTNPGFQPFGFAGGLYDQHIKLIRFGARDYDAETGRWTAKDPIEFLGRDANLYGYAFNDPVNFIDPDGQFVNIATGVIGAVIGAAIAAATGQSILAGAVSGGLAGLFPGGGILFNAAVGAATGLIGAAIDPCGSALAGAAAAGALGGVFGRQVGLANGLTAARSGLSNAVDRAFGAQVASGTIAGGGVSAAAGAF